MRIVSAFLLGLAGGMRSMSGPAVTSCAAATGLLDLQETRLAWLGTGVVPTVLATLALGELVADKLPFIPSRKSPPAFAWRVVSGAVSGSACTVAKDGPLPGLLAGVAGAVCGTLGGSALRSQLAKASGRDLPAALMEDACVGVILAGAVIALQNVRAGAIEPAPAQGDLL